MYITRKNVEKILEVMNDFPDAKSYHLECEIGSGIGSVITLTMNMDIKNRNAQVKVEIAGVEDW